MNGIEIAMEISMTDAKTFTMSTMRPLPPNGDIGAFTAGSIETTEILTTTGSILILVVMTVGGIGGGIREKIVIVGGMTTGTDMVGGILQAGATTVVAIPPLGRSNDLSTLGI